MPELPEVQTVVSDLNKKIKGEKIVSFWSDWKKAVKKPSFANFQTEIKNRKVLGVRRIGKNIFIDLTGNKTLYLHLKMTGHLLVKSQINSKLQNKNSKQKDYFSEKVNQYVHHVWYLKSQKNSKSKNQKLSAKNYDKTLEFSDVRKFAKIVLEDTDKICELPEIKKIGIDALDKKFTFSKFREILERKKKGQIGKIIMDQDLVCGIGNIYRSEILFNAKVLPQRKVESLLERELKNIFLSIKKILRKAVKMRGTSDSDYRDTSGAPGNFQKALKVYKKQGEKCDRCGTIILREKNAQRSVFYCPKCQK